MRIHAGRHRLDHLLALPQLRQRLAHVEGERLDVLSVAFLIRSSQHGGDPADFRFP